MPRRWAWQMPSAEPPSARNFGTSSPAQRSKSFFRAHRVAARPARAIERVRGICLGQTATQFWAFPHIWIPPGAVRAVIRSSAIIRPVGCLLKSTAWLTAWAPMKPWS